MDDYEKFATKLLLAFSVVIIVAMMVVHIQVTGNKAGFLFALGGGVIGWLSAFAILFDRPRIYFWLIVAAVLCVACSIGLYVR